MLDAKFVKLRKSYSIMKNIHREFPTFFALKIRFFQTYTWPHLYTLSTIYCILSISGQNRINSFYRRCLRLIYCTYRTSRTDLHGPLKLPTLEEKYRNCLRKRIKNIQIYEQELIDCAALNKHIINNLYHHYVEKSQIIGLPSGRPNKRITSFTYNNNTIFLDKLYHFISTDK